MKNESIKYKNLCVCFFFCRTSSQNSTAAGMEGKLKEKLESMGLAFLCLSTGHLSPFTHWCKFRLIERRIRI